MDASLLTKSVDEVIESAKKAFNEGNFREAVTVLEPLLQKEGRKKTLSLLQEWEAVSLVSGSYRLLHDPKAALPPARRNLRLAIQLHGKGSREHAIGLSGLGQVERELKDFNNAKKHFNDGTAVFVKLGEEKSADYGALLIGRAKVDLKQQQWKEALEGYIKAKVVMDDFKEGPSYGVIVNDMAICFMKLNRWTEALACCHEAAGIQRIKFGDQHPEYAISICNLADAYCVIKQVALALPLYEEALAINKRVFGNNHASTILVIKQLAQAHEAEKLGRKAIKSGADVRMCNNCMKVDKGIKQLCGCKKVNYCSEECQLAHWKEHRPDCLQCYSCGELAVKGVEMVHCSVCHVAKFCNDQCRAADKNKHKCVPRCYQCRKDGVKLSKCSVCLIASYCSADCQKKHWPDHKLECKKKSEDTVQPVE